MQAGEARIALQHPVDLGLLGHELVGSEDVGRAGSIGLGCHNGRLLDLGGQIQACASHQLQLAHRLVDCP